MSEHILIVDDEEPVCRLLTRILDQAGYSCVAAADSAGARSCMAQRSFDLILCDIMMPGESGIELMQHIAESHPHTGIVVVSSLDDPRSFDELNNIPLYGIIVKPFSRGQVLVTVSNALQHRRLVSEERCTRTELERLVEHQTARIRESEKTFRAIADSAHDAIVMMDNNGNISFWNHSAKKMFGYDSKEALGCNLHKFLAPVRFRDAHIKAFKNFRATGRGAAVGKTLELYAQRKGGEEFPIELSLSSVNLKGKWHAIGIIRDITERKRAAEALRKARHEIDQMMAAIHSIMIKIGSDGRVQRWNRPAADTFKIAEAHVLGKPFFECGVPLDWERMKEGISSCVERCRRIRLNDVSYIRPDGKNGFLGITLNPIIGDNGDAVGVLLMGADITDRKHLESQLAQAQKLESIGQLAAGIAHEINTPTQYVGDNIRFLEDAFNELGEVLKSYQALLSAARKGQLTDEMIRQTEIAVVKADLPFLIEEIPEAIRQSLEGVERVSKIVRSMKEFSHPGMEEKTAIDINRALESTVTVARNEWKYVADLEMDLDPALPPVPCLPGELNQVFLNMIINAVHAIADVIGDGSNGKGIIRITTRSQGDSVEIRISDTGSGIPEKIRFRIFDPFFTTKDAGKGTGQGLAISHSVIVEKHGGSLSFETEEGKGTTFIIRLPLHTD